MALPLILSSNIKIAILQHMICFTDTEKLDNLPSTRYLLAILNKRLVIDV